MKNWIAYLETSARELKAAIAESKQLREEIPSWLIQAQVNAIVIERELQKS